MNLFGITIEALLGGSKDPRFGTRGKANWMGFGSLITDVIYTALFPLPSQPHSNSQPFYISLSPGATMVMSSDCLKISYAPNACGFNSWQIHELASNFRT